MSCRQAEMTCAVLLRSYRTKYRLTTPYRIRCLSSTPRRQNDDDDDHFNPNPRTVTPPWLNKDGQMGMLNDAPEAPRIAVVGAGLTGLTAAYYLAQYLPKAKITLYEADNRVGGWMRSDEREVDVGTEKKKVIFERGPRSMSPGDAIHDQQDRLVLYDMLADHGISHTPGPKRLARYLYHPDRLVGMPPQNPLAKFIHEPLFRAIAPGGLWWALKWQFRTAKTFLKEDVSVADYVRHASRSPKLADMMSAGIHGVWGGDIEKLSAVSVFSWFFHRSTMLPDYNELFMPRRHTEDAFVKAFLKEKPHLKHMYENYKPSILTFGEFGIETLPKALEHTLTEADNVEMKMGNGVREISYVQEKDQVEVKDTSQNVELYDKVISTLPAKHLANITTPQLTLMKPFHSVSIMTVNIYYSTPNLVPPGIGYLIPRSCPEHLNPEKALGVMFDSNLLTQQSASEGGTKLFVLMGGHYYDDMEPPSLEEAIEQAKTLLHRHLGIDPTFPCFAVAKLLKDCLPQHYVGHYSRLTDVSAELNRSFHGRLAAVGGSFSRPGVMGAARAGYDIAKNVSRLDFLNNGVEEYGEAKVMNPRFPFERDGMPIVHPRN